MIDPTLIALEADQKHKIAMTPDRAKEIAEECDTLLGAMHQLRPMLSFDDSFIDFERALLRTAAESSPTKR